MAGSWSPPREPWKRAPSSPGTDLVHVPKPPKVIEGEVVHSPRPQAAAPVRRRQSVTKAAARGAAEGGALFPEGGEVIGAVSGARRARRENRAARRSRPAPEPVVGGGSSGDGGAMFPALKKMANHPASESLVEAEFIVCIVLLIVSFVAGNISKSSDVGTASDDDTSVDTVALMKRSVAVLLLFFVLGIANAAGETARKVAGALGALVTLTLFMATISDVQTVIALTDPSTRAGTQLGATAGAAADGFTAGTASGLNPDGSSSGAPDGSGDQGGGLLPDGTSSRLAGRTR